MTYINEENYDTLVGLLRKKKNVIVMTVALAVTTVNALKITNVQKIVHVIKSVTVVKTANAEKLANVETNVIAVMNVVVMKMMKENYRRSFTVLVIENISIFPAHVLPSARLQHIFA